MLCFVHPSKLVELFDLSPLVCEYVKDMICTNVQHFLKDYVDDFAHPCISLLKCFFLSHTLPFICRSLLILQNDFSCCKLFCFFSHLYSLAYACVRIYLGGSEDSMLCTLY